METGAHSVRPLSQLAERPAFETAIVADEPVLDLRSYLFVLLRHRWTVASVALVVLGIATIRTLHQRKIYTASVSLVIETPPKVLGDQVQDVSDQGSSYWQSKEFYETQFRILKSRAVAERVVRKLALDRDDAFLGLEGVSDPAERARARGRESLAVGLLGQKVRVEPVRDSRVVNVIVDDHDPQKAALIANTLADEFTAYNLAQKLGTSRSASEWLHDQIDELQKKLAQSEEALYRFKRENDILTSSLEDGQSIVSKRLSAISETLTQVRIHRAELAGKVAQVREARRAGNLGSLPQAAASGPVQSLRGQAILLDQQLAEDQDRYGPGHPKRAALSDRQKAVLRLMREEEERLAASVEIEERQLAATEANLVGLLDAAKREAFEMTRKEADYSRLRREQENSAKVVELVTRRLKDVDLAGLLRTNNVRVLDTAEVPGQPSSPKLGLALLTALCLGLGGGIGVALLLERLDNTIKTQGDLEKHSRASFLGLVPRVEDELGNPAASIDLRIHAKPRSAVAECLRTVRTNLLFMGTAAPLQRILITSAGPQEGKSLMAIDLAISFAQSGQRVLIVDSDLRRPRLHRAFGLSNEVGLSSVILDESKLAQALKPTEIANLTVLCCGPIPPNPAELLQTERFAAVCAELSRRYDRIVFDSPPVAAVSDPLILASRVDGVIVVARAGESKKESMVRTRRALANVNARVVGAVLNAVDLRDRGAGDYYQYYSKDGDGYGEGGEGRAG